MPTTFVKNADNLQGTVYTPVVPAPSVTIKDADGKPIAGISVTFTAGSGGGSVTGATATTDGNGVAIVGSWVLGTIVGINTLTAAAVNVPGSPLTFTATGTAGPAATITALTVLTGTPPAGTNLDSLRVKIADQFGNAVSGATVTFAVTSGGGTVSPTSAITGLGAEDLG